MPVRSLHFLAAVFFSAAVFARYQGSEARKIEVSCSCTKSPSNAVVNKFAKCESGTYYTACCNRQHRKFNCIFSATKKENKSHLGSSRPEIASSSSPCATMGTANLFNMSVDICEEFHAGAVAISLPQDTDFVKYGDISCPRLGSSKLCHFNDRFSWIVDPGPSTNVTLYPFSSDLVRYILDNTPDNASTSMMVFKAEFNKTSDEREIVALTLVLFIDPRAMMRPFMGLSFIGTLINKNQGPDVGSSYWFRWDLSDRFVLEDSMWLLEGFFTNLYNGVYETNQTGGLCPKDFDTCNDVCRPTLISWVNEETWFNEAVGYGSIKFYWNSGVRAPLDSQFVPVFQAKDNWIKEYMAPLPTPSMLLSSNVQVDDSYSFLNMAISDYSQLQYFNGNFSRQKPYKTCGHYLPGSGVVP